MTNIQEGKRQSAVKVIGLTALVVFFAALVFGAVSYEIFEKDRPVLTFTALPAEAALDISLIQNGKSIALIPLAGNKFFVEQGNPQGSYILTIAIKDVTQNKYHDIIISYRADTGFATIVADGFSSADTITISDTEELNFDWSGKIEFSTAALPENSASCLKTSAGISFCHALPERTGA